MLDGLWDWITGVLTGILNGLIQAAEHIYNALLWIIGVFGDAFDIIKEAFVTLLKILAIPLLLIANVFIQVAGGIWAILSSFAEMIYHFIKDTMANITWALEVGSMVFEVLKAAAAKLAIYLMQVVDLIRLIITGITESEFTPVPGLPRCVSAPMETDWCAIWYITDWTLFAPDTPGAWIIPVVVLIIDLFIVIYLARAIFKAIRWFISLFQVS